MKIFRMVYLTLALGGVFTGLHSPNASAHYYAYKEALGCGGAYKAWLYSWQGHPYYGYAQVDKATINTGPWGSVLDDANYSMCYGPVEILKWWRTEWCHVYGGSECADIDMEWIPAEPCGGQQP